MASQNPFELLVDEDNDDVSQLIQKLPTPVAAAPKKPAAAGAPAQPAKQAKLPSKPTPPAQAVREAKTEGPRGGGRFGGRGTGRGRGGGRGFNRDALDNENANNNGFSGGYRPSEEIDGEKSSERRAYGGGQRGAYRGGGRRGGFSNGDAVEGERPPRRVFERRSGTGRGNEFKRDGAGRGNWGTPADDVPQETEDVVNESDKAVDAEKPAGQEDAVDASKENPEKESEEKEPEEKEMTLGEYEKVLEEKRKALLAQKAEERVVVVDKELQSMQLLSNKKSNDDIFVKLGADKDKRKEAAEKEERAKKSLSINEFLKPAEGEKYYNPGGRGRGGRGRGPRGGGYGGGGYGYGGRFNDAAAPSIEDVGQFPSLGVK